MPEQLDNYGHQPVGFHTAGPGPAAPSPARHRRLSEAQAFWGPRRLVQVSEGSLGTGATFVSARSLRVVFTAATGVVACVPAQGGFIIVAERNGAIVEHSNNAGGVAQDPGAAFITSMVSNGVALAWTQMASQEIAPGQLDARWQLRGDAGISGFNIPTGANPRLAMFNAAGDLFWLDDDGVATSPV